MAEQATQVSTTASRSAGALPIVIVVNDSDRIKGFIYSGKSAAGDIVHEPVRLKPGANRLTREDFAKVERDLKTDDRVWILDKSFSALSERDAEALAKQTIDVALLEAFKSVEKRTRPLAALNEQIKACAQRAHGPAESAPEEDAE